MRTKLTKLLFALFAVMVGTSVNAQTSGDCGDNATWSYESTTLTISGTGAMDDYAYGEAPWNAYAGEMTSLVIESGITSVGNNAFAGCEKLNTVQYPATGFTSIGDYAFTGCKVKYVSLPHTLITLGEGAFSGCQTKSASIPGSVKKIGDYAFNGCKLQGVSIYEGVEEIGEDAFCNNANLTSINLNEGLRTLRLGAFTSCTALSEIMLPASLETIEGAVFFDCSALSSIGIDEANPYFVTKDGILYSRDLKRFICLPSGMPVEDFTIPESVETMEAYCCSGHASLVTVIVPKNVTTIGENAFSYCPNMIGCVIEENVDSIGQTIFAGCEKMENVFMLAKTPAKHVHQLGIYSDELYDHGMLYVPQESLDLYKEQYWVVYREDDVSDNVVKTIKGMTDAEIAELRGEDPETGIATPATQQAGPTKAYDLQGRRLTNLTKGLQIITLPDGTSKKVIR